MKKYVVIGCFLVLVELSSFGQDHKFVTTGKGQLNAWGILNLGENTKVQLGLRFIPTIQSEVSFGQKLKLDGEASLNTVGSMDFLDWKKNTAYESFKPYRLWLRISSEKFELRAGLQKINFGSATMLRPLMWFDQVDPRDPLQLTDGVYGLLGRYYFKNNANLWLWGLYGNSQTKGWEYIQSVKDIPEFGGRFQFPLLKGEFATSFHHRTINTSSIPFSMGPFYDVAEYRIGLDGKWDKEIGFWFESSFSQLALGFLQTPYQFILNIGADYTISIGNGINLIYEQLFFTLLDEDFTKQLGSTFSTLSVGYPIGLMDRISLMAYYDWMNETFYRFINYQRTYDNWIWYIMAYWNPENFALYNRSMDNNLFAGKGFQLMAVYNF